MLSLGELFGVGLSQMWMCEYLVQQNPLPHLSPAYLAAIFMLSCRFDQWCQTLERLIFCHFCYLSAWGCRFNQRSTSHQSGGLYGWLQSLRQDARRRSRGWETSSNGFQTKQIQTITRKKSLITFIFMSKGSQMPTVPEKLVSILVNSCAKVSSSVALFAGTFICFFFCLFHLLGTFERPWCVSNHPGNGNWSTSPKMHFLPVKTTQQTTLLYINRRVI